MQLNTGDPGLLPLARHPGMTGFCAVHHFNIPVILNLIQDPYLIV
jgi:hypothetical protein